MGDLKTKNQKSLQAALGSGEAFVNSAPRPRSQPRAVRTFFTTGSLIPFEIVDVLFEGVDAFFHFSNSRTNLLNVCSHLQADSKAKSTIFRAKKKANRSGTRGALYRLESGRMGGPKIYKIWLIELQNSCCAKETGQTHS